MHCYNGPSPRSDDSMNILRVALDVPLATLFDYLDGGNTVQAGQRVLVPFGRRQVIGIVISRSNTSEFEVSRLKPIICAFEEENPLPQETLKLLAFCTDYYQYPFGQALLAALPSRLREAQPAALPKRIGYGLTDAALEGGIELIRVFHTSRDLPRHFQGE